MNNQLAARLDKFRGFCFLGFAAVLFNVVSPGLAVEQVRFNEDGYLIIGDTPTLILGMYELPQDVTLKELADNGFNLVRASADKKVLDRVHKFGLYAWIPLGYELALPEEDAKAREKLARTITEFKDHPALLAWEAPDEALWNVWYNRQSWNYSEQYGQLRELITKAKNDLPAEKCEQMNQTLTKAHSLMHRGLWYEAEALYDRLWKQLGKNNPKPELKESLAAEQARELGEKLTRGWQVVRSLDPAHVFWQNHAPRNSIESMRFYNRAVDAAGCDIYPVPFNGGPEAALHSDLTDTNLTSVGAYTERMRAAAPSKAVWMVLQGFGWKDLRDPPPPDDSVAGRRPALAETRFMAYDAIVHGANAILYWGTYKIEKDGILWRDIMRVAKEIRSLAPAIVGRQPAQPPVAVAEETFSSLNGQGPRLLLAKTQDDWALIAVNESPTGIAFNLTGLPEELNGKTLYRLYSDESHQVTGGGFRDGIGGFNVHVYATSRNFEVR